MDFDWVYIWGNNPKRKTMKGKLCRVISRATRMRSVLIELEDGRREIVSYRALRQAPGKRPNPLVGDNTAESLPLLVSGGGSDGAEGDKADGAGH